MPALLGKDNSMLNHMELNVNSMHNHNHIESQVNSALNHMESQANSMHNYMESQVNSMDNPPLLRCAVGDVSRDQFCIFSDNFRERSI